MDVVYYFDRLHENTADSYSSSAESAGFEFGFDKRQVLSVMPATAMQLVGLN